ncbi:MAG: NADH-quinone oxidoreductase subunit I, partial [Pedobacter sp.]|nr:NADH-quinone oxidoreductase subunit I [Pedobacter sp.]
MESLSNKKKVLEQKPLNLAERMYLPTIVKGLSTTISHFLKKPATIKYPEQVREFSINWRGMHSLKRDEEGRERCTAC